MRLELWECIRRIPWRRRVAPFRLAFALGCALAVYFTVCMAFGVVLRFCEIGDRQLLRTVALVGGIFGQIPAGAVLLLFCFSAPPAKRLLAAKLGIRPVTRRDWKVIGICVAANLLLCGPVTEVWELLLDFCRIPHADKQELAQIIAGGSPIQIGLILIGAVIVAPVVEEIAFRPQMETALHNLLKTGRYLHVALDLYKNAPEDRDSEGMRMARALQSQHPAVELINVSRQLRKQRTIKQPCEIEAMRQAVTITRDGILAMMRASRPGMYEYQYKAEFDYALAQRGCLSPAFPSIVSAGENNFCIHYYDYTGQAKDGDMILNDVGAQYGHLFNDVSRGWPCNGVFSEKQRLLYTCAYNTSQHMFSIIRPGMKMADADRLAREYNYEQLKAIGLCQTYDDIGKYMWHGGAHHVGWDTHDVVEAEIIEPGMVFCVDIGIYCQEWGIGFRLEDTVHGHLGEVADVDTSTPNTLFVIDRGGNELLVPAREEFILDMDMKFLCREDCKGLCSTCGKNLNLGPCGCRKEIDPRFAVLEQLLDK